MATTHHPSKFQKRAVEYVARCNAQGHTPSRHEVIAWCGGTPRATTQCHRELTALMDRRLKAVETDTHHGLVAV